MLYKQGTAFKGNASTNRGLCTEEEKNKPYMTNKKGRLLKEMRSNKGQAVPPSVFIKENSNHTNWPIENQRNQ